MPQIKAYDAPQGLGLAPTETGVEAQAAEGRRIGAFFNQTSQQYSDIGHRVDSAVQAAGRVAVKYADQQELSQGGLEETKARFALAKAWEQAKKDAQANGRENDPSIAPSFLENTLEPTLEKFRDGFRTEAGQNWAEARIHSLRNHYEQKTTADMSTIAGQAIQTNLHQSANIGAGIVAADPSSLKSEMEAWKMQVGAVTSNSPNITGEMAGRMRNDITEKGLSNLVMTAARTSITNNPDTLSMYTNDPELSKYIDANALKQLQTQSDRVRKMDDAYAKHEARQQIQDRANAARDDIFVRMHSPDTPADKKVTAKEILAEPAFKDKPEIREHLLRDFDNMANGRGAATNESKSNAVDMILAIRAGKITDMEPLYKALGDRQIDYQRFKEVETELVGRKTADGRALAEDRGRFMHYYTENVNPRDAFGERHPEGAIRAHQLEVYAQQQEEILRKQGMAPADIAKKLYTDYNSPLFIGQSPYAKGPSPAEFMEEAKKRRMDASARPGRPAAPEEKPPAAYPGAKKGTDGHYYIPDPARPGKFLMVQ